MRSRKHVATGLLVLLAPLAACSTNLSGRTWELADKRSDRIGTSISVQLLAGENRQGLQNELWQQGGCLEYHVEVGVNDEIDQWNVYRVTERTAAGLIQKSYVITDPPGKPYPGATTEARPDQVVGIPREPTGARLESLQLREYPVSVEWQLSDSTSEGPWLEESDPKLILSGSKVLSAANATEEYVVHLCKKELDQLLQYPANEFRFAIRVSPSGWTDADRAIEGAKVLYARRGLRRKVIEDVLDRTSRLAPALQGVPEPAPESP
jgi:hypothetical protein